MRTASSLVILSVLLVAQGCAHTVPMAAAPASVQEPSAPVAKAADEPLSDAKTTVRSESAAFTQKPGDYVVYKFSGAFKKAPLTLTQRVVEASDELLVVDLTFDDGKRTTSVRAHYTHAPWAAQELLKAFRLDASGATKPMPLSELDALMAQTSLAADENQGAVGSEKVVVSVSGRDFPCTSTRYRVTVGKHVATMRTFSSEAFPWGDVGADIVSDDGKVLYRAEVVEAGGSSPIVAASR
jgi:hypothetical protein